MPFFAALPFDDVLSYLHFHNFFLFFFRKGKRTKDAYSISEWSWRQQLKSRRICMRSFIDLENAFDTVKYGLSVNLLKRFELIANGLISASSCSRSWSTQSVARHSASYSWRYQNYMLSMCQIRASRCWLTICWKTSASVKPRSDSAHETLFRMSFIVSAG